ncbi:MAG: chemotaxis protein CheW [Sphingomonadales bacterium]|nr:chemotaxis protein CheW [Sphingomonadales bacterium]
MHRELITFEVGGQVFGLDIMAIREIRAWTPTTRLPRVPHYVAGVVNLRGTVLPVIDLAARLGWEPTEASPRHAIIVAQLGSQTCGLIVESVSDIVTLPSDALQPPPVTANDSIIAFLEGLAAIDDHMVMVLNLSALGDGGEFSEAA